MTTTTLLALIRKELKDSWKNEKVFIEHGSAYSKRRDQHDSALMAVEQLMERLAEPVQEQPALVALPMPPLDREISLKVDQLDKQIDQATATNDFARATALRARKAQMMRAAGL